MRASFTVSAAADAIKVMGRRRGGPTPTAAAAIVSVNRHERISSIRNGERERESSGRNGTLYIYTGPSSIYRFHRRLLLSSFIYILFK